MSDCAMVQFKVIESPQENKFESDLCKLAHLPTGGCDQHKSKRAGYSLDIMLQTACLVFNPIMVEDYAALFSCTAVDEASDSMKASM